MKEQERPIQNAQKDLLTRESSSPKLGREGTIFMDDNSPEKIEVKIPTGQPEAEIGTGQTEGSFSPKGVTENLEELSASVDKEKIDPEEAKKRWKRHAQERGKELNNVEKRMAEDGIPPTPDAGRLADFLNFFISDGTASLKREGPEGPEPATGGAGGGRGNIEPPAGTASGPEGERPEGQGGENRIESQGSPDTSTNITSSERESLVKASVSVGNAQRERRRREQRAQKASDEVDSLENAYNSMLDTDPKKQEASARLKDAKQRLKALDDELEDSVKKESEALADEQIAKIEIQRGKISPKRQTDIHTRSEQLTDELEPELTEEDRPKLTPDEEATLSEDEKNEKRAFNEKLWEEMKKYNREARNKMRSALNAKGFESEMLTTDAIKLIFEKLNNPGIDEGQKKILVSQVIDYGRLVQANKPEEYEKYYKKEIDKLNDLFNVEKNYSEAKIKAMELADKIKDLFPQTRSEAVNEYMIYSLEDLARLVMNTAEDKWRTGGEFEIIGEKGEFHPENFLGWIRNRIVYYHGLNPDEPVDLFNLVGVPTTYRIVPLSEIISTPKFWRKEDIEVGGQYVDDEGKKIPTRRIFKPKERIREEPPPTSSNDEYDSLRDQILLESWLFSDNHTNDASYRLIMGREDQIAQKQAESNYWNKFTKKRARLLRMLKMPGINEIAESEALWQILKLREHNPGVDTSDIDQEKQGKVGREMRRLIAGYRFISDEYMLKQVLGRSEKDVDTEEDLGKEQIAQAQKASQERNEYEKKHESDKQHRVRVVDSDIYDQATGKVNKTRELIVEETEKVIDSSGKEKTEWKEVNRQSFSSEREKEDGMDVFFGEIVKKVFSKEIDQIRAKNVEAYKAIWHRNPPSIKDLDPESERFKDSPEQQQQIARELEDFKRLEPDIFGEDKNEFFNLLTQIDPGVDRDKLPKSSVKRLKMEDFDKLVADKRKFALKAWRDKFGVSLDNPAGTDWTDINKDNAKFLDLNIYSMVKNELDRFNFVQAAMKAGVKRAEEDAIKRKLIQEGVDINTPEAQRKITQIQEDLDYANTWAFSFTYWTGISAYNETGAIAFDKDARRQHHKENRFRQASGRGAAGLEETISGINQLGVDWWQGLRVKTDGSRGFDKTLVDVLLGIEDTRLTPEEKRGAPFKIHINLDKDIENFEFTGNAQRQFATEHLLNGHKLAAFLERHGLNLVQIIDRDAYGRIWLNWDKFIELVPDGVWHDLRYCFDQPGWNLDQKVRGWVKEQSGTGRGDPIFKTMTLRQLFVDTDVSASEEILSEQGKGMRVYDRVGVAGIEENDKQTKLARQMLAWLVGKEIKWHRRWDQGSSRWGINEVEQIRWAFQKWSQSNKEIKREVDRWVNVPIERDENGKVTKSVRKKQKETILETVQAAPFFTDQDWNDGVEMIAEAPHKKIWMEEFGYGLSAAASDSLWAGLKATFSILTKDIL